MDRAPLQSKTDNVKPSRLMKPGSFLPKPTGLPKPTTVSGKRKADDSLEPVLGNQKRAKVLPTKTNISVTNGVASKAVPAIKRPGVGVKKPVQPMAARPVAARTGPATSRPASRPVGSSCGQRSAANTSRSSTSSNSSIRKAPTRPPRPEVKVKELEAQTKTLEEENTEIKSQMEELRDKLEAAVREVATLEEKLSSTERTLRARDQDLEDLEKRLRATKAEKEELEDDIRRLKRELQRREDDLEDKKNQISGLKDTVGNLKDDIRDKDTRISEMTTRAAEQRDTILELRETLTDRNSKISSMEKTIDSQCLQIAELESKIREDERIRRQLHNTIQELKGNIRVFCRVRPLIGNELASFPDGEIQHISFGDDGKSLELEKLSDISVNESIMSQTGRNGKGKYHFNFDQVFNPGASQAQVFEEISQLVQSALDGYHVAIFAYGQTGSGKTFTMEGPTNPSEETWGMIPRAVEQVFKTALSMAEQGWKYELQVSFLEIYNETIRDLLGNHKDDVKHELKMVSQNSKELMVTNLTTVTVKTPSEVYKLLKKANESRAVAETKANERSSRSHSVFRLHIQGHNTHTDEKSAGYLNMIDLAGSERLKESKSEGERLKETKNINSSLANLGNVIMALANKENHVPYRNSKLTHLLSNSLGGSSKVLMFLNISPREECFGETLNSLRFATKVNNCHIGTAQKKTK